MKKIIFSMVCVSMAFSGVEFGKPCFPVPYYMVGIYSNSLDIDLHGKFSELDDLLEDKNDEAKSRWEKINGLFDSIMKNNVEKLKLLKKITAIKQSSNLDKLDTLFQLEKEKQLLGNYGDLIGMGKDGNE